MLLSLRLFVLSRAFLSIGRKNWPKGGFLEWILGTLQSTFGEDIASDRNVSISDSVGEGEGEGEGE